MVEINYLVNLISKYIISTYNLMSSGIAMKNYILYNMITKIKFIKREHFVYSI